jgi:HemY protein
MIRAALILVVGAIAALIALQYAEDPGALTLRWGGVWVETSALFALIATALVLAIALPGVRLAALAINAPGAARRTREADREARTREALVVAVLAAEAGDADATFRNVERADQTFPAPALTALLAARAAEAEGDVARAEQNYTALLSHEHAHLLARRKLAALATRRGDRAAAVAHAEAALRQHPSATWPVEAAFELRIAAGDWAEALLALDEAERRRLLPELVAQRRRAALLAAAAARQEQELQLDAACDFAERATRLAPELAPAAIIAARLLVGEGKAWKAQAVLEDCWAARPHPAIAQAYRDIRADESPGDTRARLAALVQRMPEHREARLLAAEIALQQGQWKAAAEALAAARRERVTNRVLILQAAQAAGSGDEAKERKLLAEAASAPREPDFSDLDPAGPPFRYDTDAWARLVLVFGDTGEIVHRRLERGEPDAAQAALLGLPRALSGAPAADKGAWRSEEAA